MTDLGLDSNQHHGSAFGEFASIVTGEAGTSSGDVSRLATPNDAAQEATASSASKHLLRVIGGSWRCSMTVMRASCRFRVIEEKATRRGSIKRIGSSPQVSDDVCAEALSDFQDRHGFRVSDEANLHLDPCVRFGRHIDVSNEDIDKRRCVSASLLFSKCDASKLEADSDPGVALNIDHRVSFSTGSRGRADRNNEQQIWSGKVAAHREVDRAAHLQPSFRAIVRHRIAIWRARRLIDKAHRCADKAIKLCPQMLREPAP